MAVHSVEQYILSLLSLQCGGAARVAFGGPCVPDPRIAEEHSPRNWRVILALLLFGGHDLLPASYHWIFDCSGSVRGSSNRYDKIKAFAQVAGPTVVPIVLGLTGQ